MGHHMFADSHALLCCAALQRKAVRRPNVATEMGEFVFGAACVCAAATASDDVSGNVDRDQSVGHRHT